MVVAGMEVVVVLVSDEKVAPHNSVVPHTTPRMTDPAKNTNIMNDTAQQSHFPPEVEVSGKQRVQLFELLLEDSCIGCATKTVLLLGSCMSDGDDGESPCTRVASNKGGVSFGG